MSENEPIHGLTCPKCGGMVPVPEGQAIVCCPYCNLRSQVQGDHGLRRFQVPVRVNQAAAVGMLQKFLTSSWSIARDAPRRAELSETFLVYLPFWTVWGRVAGWVFGQKQVGSGDNKHYEPREVRIVQEMTWNGAACDVGEFGVSEVPLLNRDLAPFNPDELHQAGLVFEPVGSFSDAKAAAQKMFDQQIRQKAGLDRISQTFIRNFQQRYALVYYPLWVVRYLYRGRAFQMVLDGYSGKALYGKAPGNTLYRAGVLVAGMAAGAFLSVDVSVFLLSQMGRSDDGNGLLVLAGLSLLGGLALMAFAYRKFRYGEQYEYRSVKTPLLEQVGNPLEAFSQINAKDVEEWIKRLS